MARTIDELVLKVNVEGTAQVKTATAEIQNLDKTTQTAGKNLNQAAAGIRNIGFQVQDFTVQVANGTSAITALSQQLPQLLSNFGTFGVYLGIAAAAIPLVAAGFKLLGGDTRDLDERLKDAKDSIDRFQNSAKNNITSVQALGTEFNGLESAAKRYYELKENVDRIAAFNNLTSAIVKAKTEFGFLNDEIIKRAQTPENANTANIFGPLANVEAMRLIEAKKLGIQLGLNTEQVIELGNRLKQLDAGAPEKNLDVITETSYWLLENVKDAGKLNDVLKLIIYPLLDINQQVLEFNRNIKESGDRSVRMANDMAGLNAKFLPAIADAKARFDQIGAARLDAELKVQQQIANLRQRADLTDAQKTLLLLSLRKDAATDILVAEKNLVNQQKEAYYGMTLQNDAKATQIALERALTDIRADNLFGLEENIRYDETIARNASQLTLELERLHEARKKNTITQAQLLDLEAQAFQLRFKQDEQAEMQRNADIRKRIILDEIELIKRSAAEQQARFQAIGGTLQSVNAEIAKEMLKRPDDMVGFNALQKQIIQIEAAAKQAAQSAAAAYSKQFESEDVLNPQAAAQFAQGLDQITQAYRRLADIQIQFAQEQYNIQRTFEFGWRDAFAKFAEDAANNAEYARSIFTTFTRGFEDAFVNFVRTGKLSFKDLANNILAEVTRMAANKLLLSILGMGGSGGGGFFASLGSLFGGFFADGGRLGPGKFGVVGENGPELITGPANVTPIGGGGATTVTYNIQAVDASSFRSLVARDPEFIFQVTEQGRRSLPIRSRR